MLEDKKSNLGWRIVAQFIVPKDDFHDLLEQTHAADPKPFCDLIARPHKCEAGRMLRLLRALRRGDGSGDNPDLLDRLLTSIGADRDQMASDFLRDELGSDSTQRADPAIRKLPIKATTIQSSKGLAEDYVFITHFDDLYFIKDKDKANITDHDVCSFLVALTRARKRVYLVSSNPKATPAFLTWISPDRIQDLTVPADHPEPDSPH